MWVIWGGVEGVCEGGGEGEGRDDDDSNDNRAERKHSQKTRAEVYTTKGKATGKEHASIRSHRFRVCFAFCACARTHSPWFVLLAVAVWRVEGSGDTHAKGISPAARFPHGGFCCLLCASR